MGCKYSVVQLLSSLKKWSSALSTVVSDSIDNLPVSAHSSFNLDSTNYFSIMINLPKPVFQTLHTPQPRFIRQSLSSSNNTNSLPRATPSNSSPNQTIDKAISTLRLAVSTKKVAPDIVVQALNALPATTNPDFPTALDGSWILVFAIPAPIPAWAYIPVEEIAIIDSKLKAIELISYVGPIKTSFRGNCRFETDNNSSNKMVFGFSNITVSGFGRTLLEKEREAKEKTYDFFLLNDDIAAANSSGTGGKVLMTRCVCS
jgi:hypothetical protein